jgi:hypothetical protein
MATFKPIKSFATTVICRAPIELGTLSTNRIATKYVVTLRLVLAWRQTARCESVCSALRVKLNDRCMKKYLVNKKRLTLKETRHSYTSTRNLFVHQLLDDWKIGIEDTFPVSDIKPCVDVNTGTCLV